jgi:hypothetical protein
MNCPGCDAPMTEHTLAAHMGASVTIDACPACQAFWFDGRESLQLTPASTLRLFRLIGDGTPAARHPLPAITRCPRCLLRLAPVEDRQRNTRFRYRRCARGHGRFITFFDFLREKDFVKPLSAAQLADLRAHVQTVNCSNCGAPIDLARASACAHCGSALSMLDMTHVESLVDRLREADAATGTIDPALPLELLRARRQTEALFAQAAMGNDWYRDVSSAGTVGAGLMALARWLGGRDS